MGRFDLDPIRMRFGFRVRTWIGSVSLVDQIPTGSYRLHIARRFCRCHM